MTIPLIVPELIDLENSEDRFRDNVPGSSYSDKPSHPNSASRTLNTAPNNPGWALQELVEQASEDNVTATISSSALPTHRLSKAGWWIGGTFSALAAFAGGFFVGRMSDAKFKDETTLTGESASTGESTLPVEPHEALLAAASAPELTVSGRIMFVDGSGKEQPDSEAFLLLVPAENAAGLKLDATPLRSLEPSAAQEAVEAAIRILNGSVARAAQDGTFVMDRRESGPMKLVAISRHASRPESTPVESAAAETIAAWFDSPSQLTGRLQVQEIQIPSARQNEKRIVNVTFNRH